MAKAKKLKGLLIDPEWRKVSEVMIDADKKLRSIYKVLECDTVAIAHDGIPGVDIWIDEEGMFKDPEHFFMPPAYIKYSCWIARRGLILGHDLNGDCTDHTLTAEQIETLRTQIKFGIKIKEIET